jgi:hypothetical protein
VVPAGVVYKGDNVTQVPEQILIKLLGNITVGFSFTVTTAVAVPVHPLEVVPVTVYVVVEVGVATTVDPVVVFNPVLGAELYVFAPLAVSVAEFPEQTALALEEMVTTGLGTTVTVEIAVPLQPKLVPVTVYVVVTDGVT